MTAIEESILKLDRKLKGVPFDFAFLGGSVLSLLVTDPMVDAIRVTKDVDVMMNIRTRRDYHRMDAMLEELGFRHDTRDDAPICRWIYEDVTVDILPIREEVLGWRSKWFEDALDEAAVLTRGSRSIKVVSPPYFVALKIEAFEDRGRGDFLTSTDFEDIICLFNGRETIVEEIAGCARLCKGLAEKFSRYLADSELEDAIEGFVQTETNPNGRKSALLAKFTAVANLKTHSCEELFVRIASEMEQ